jgi:hypothetical protein
MGNEEKVESNSEIRHYDERSEIGTSNNRTIFNTFNGIILIFLHEKLN